MERDPRRGEELGRQPPRPRYMRDVRPLDRDPDRQAVDRGGETVDGPADRGPEPPRRRQADVDPDGTASGEPSGAAAQVFHRAVTAKAADLTGRQDVLTGRQPGQDRIRGRGARAADRAAAGTPDDRMDRPEP